MDRDFSPEDIEKNRVYAGLGYIVFFLPLILCGDSKLGRYCANQGLLLLLATVLAWAFFGAFGMIPWIGWIFSILGRLAALALFMVGILCYMQLITNDRVVELPYIGGFRLLP